MTPYIYTLNKLNQQLVLILYAKNKGVLELAPIMFVEMNSEINLSITCMLLIVIKSL